MQIKVIGTGCDKCDKLYGNTQEALTELGIEAQLEKVPYMIVIGDKEVENGTVTLRSRVSGDLGSFKIDDVVSKINKETAERIIETKQ